MACDTPLKKIPGSAAISTVKVGNEIKESVHIRNIIVVSGVWQKSSQQKRIQQQLDRLLGSHLRSTTAAVVWVRGKNNTNRCKLPRSQYGCCWILLLNLSTLLLCSEGAPKVAPYFPASQSELASVPVIFSSDPTTAAKKLIWLLLDPPPEP